MKSGSIQVDGDNIHDNLNSYWNIIGYVSQKPYLIKDTVAWNITLKNSLTKNEKLKLKKYIIFVDYQKSFQIIKVYLLLKFLQMLLSYLVDKNNDYRLQGFCLRTRSFF